MIIETLESHAIPLVDCRAQGYDNAASISGKYNSAQAIIKKTVPYCYILSLWLPNTQFIYVIIMLLKVFRSEYLLQNNTNNMYFIQLQSQEVGNISKAD